MKRVLVTGATGFVGRAVLHPLLDRGYDVHAVTSRHPLPAPAIHWHQADLLADGAGASIIERVRPTHLLHLAWYAAPGLYWTSPLNLRWVEASLALLRAFADMGGRRVVSAGTCAEYDWRHSPFVEDVTPLQPRRLYGTCKDALGRMQAAFAAQAAIESAWCRLFFLFGPHEHETRLVPAVINSLLAAQPAACTAGTQVRDFLHTEDAGAAFAAVLDSEVTGAVNIASGEGTAVADVVTHIGASLGRRDLLRLGAVPMPPDEPASIVADVRRLRSEVRFTPARSLDARLDQAIDWWKTARAGVPS